MKCLKCGSENEDNVNFCKSCGSPLTSKSNTKLKIAIPIVLIVLIVFGIFTYIIFIDTSQVEVIQLNNKNPGNIYQNRALASNIPNSQEVTDVCNAAKSGVPVYKIGDGSGPVTVICTGIHGDQLSSQVAALDLIDYLDGRKITGTVYVIPFAAPGATANNIKLSDGVNLNTVADQPGSSSNDIVNFAISNNASAVGDFHGTEPGKNPGKTTVMCSQYPTYESFEIAQKMNIYLGGNTMTYTIAGIAYDGAVEDVLNLKGIPAVTPLVLSNHGSVNQGSVQQSLSQMIALLEVNGNIGHSTYDKLANLDIDGF